MKVWVLMSHEFQASSQVWDVYEDAENAKKDINLPNDLEWRYSEMKNHWYASSDLTWNSYRIEEFEVK